MNDDFLGETIFPLADVPETQRHLLGGNIDYRNCELGVKVKPVRGNAILW